MGTGDRDTVSSGPTSERDGPSEEEKEGEERATESNDSGSDSDNDSSSGSEASDSSSSSSNVLARPVFIAKTKRAHVTATPSLRSITLAKAEFASAVDSLLVPSDQFDGVDDTDDVDPAAEYGAWRARERARLQAHRAQLQSDEAEKNDALRRRERG